MKEERFATPFGPLIALATSRGLCALEFDRPARRRLLDARLRRYFGGEAGGPASGSGAALRATRAWLHAYFAGDFDRLPAVPLDLRGTEFERKIWGKLRAIAPGHTVSYGTLAAGSARAVGSACRRNPVGLIVPCHRVVGKGGHLTGYGGGLDRKAWLIAHEAGIKSSRSKTFPKARRAS